MESARLRWLLVTVSLLVIVVLGVALVPRLAPGGGGGEPAGQAGAPVAGGGATTAGAVTTAWLRDAVGAEGIERHLEAFARIAEANGGNRAAGTPGYDASADYVVEQLRAAGYEPRVEAFDMPVSQAARRAELVVTAGAASPPSFAAGTDYATLEYSGSGEVTAALAAVDLTLPPTGGPGTSGCEREDFDGFARGRVALLQRGTCTIRQKVDNAARAGAAAALVMNEGTAGNEGLAPLSLGGSGIEVPALSLSHGAGRQLAALAGSGGTVRVVAQSATGRSVNIIAETAGADDRVVMVGAHLDSIAGGPGINDNASGSALLLELARAFAEGDPPANRVRFAWWGAEEIGLVGSSDYARRLSDEQVGQIAAYLNFDMIGSRNFARFVYHAEGQPAGSAEIQRLFEAWFSTAGLEAETVDLSARSDHGPFASRRIPVGGLFSGAEGPKTRDEADGAGGRAGDPHDPCYHEACDTLDNIDRAAVDEFADGAAHAVATLAASTAEVDAARGD